MTCSRKETARQVLEVVPLVMRTVRTEMRRHRAHHLSVPRFRALGFVQRCPGASLSDVAEHIGLTLPAMSKLIDGLVTRKLMTRRGHADDRRRVTLELTARGAALLQTARESTHVALAERLSQLGESDRAAIVRAMHILQPLFAHETTSD
jgi:DNA-binding MarR family transcriptional regulator